MGQQIQVIDGDGNYCSDEVTEFTQQNSLAEAGPNYVIVAIMGPQSSGKSTLLNTLFGTDFKMMNADLGRKQTTKGIWLDRSVKTTEVPTLVMDLEGSDGRERGEDDTTFERQSALFALATSDILLVNMFAVNIGRVQGSGAPLLKTIFQVNLKLFQPAPGKRKMCLLFVIRDRTKTPLSKLCSDLRQDLDSIWESLVKPPEQAECTVSDFFDVNYVSLPSYEVEEDDFRAEATILRRKFLPSHEDSLVKPEEHRVPAGALPLNFGTMWDLISTQKDLDLPAHKVMVASVRCNQISDEHATALQSDQAWTALHTESQAGIVVSDFKSRATELISSCVYGYDQEAVFFETGVRGQVQQELRAKLLADLEPAFRAQLALRSSHALATLRSTLSDAQRLGLEAFDDAAARGVRDATVAYSAVVDKELRVEGSEWSAGIEEMTGSAQAVVEGVRGAHVDACRAAMVEEVEAAVEGPTWEVLSQLPEELWTQLRQIVKNAISSAVARLDGKLTGYGIGKERLDELHKEVGLIACQKLIKVLRDDLRRAADRLKAKFDSVFEEDNGVTRVWSARLDIPTIAKEANVAAVKLLAQLALAPKRAGLLVPSASDEDVTKAKRCIMHYTARDIEPSAVASEQEGLLTMARWYDTVPAEAVLLQPQDVRSVWRQFLQDSKKAVHRATELQEERRRSASKGLPVWALAAGIVLGWNEAKVLLYNPLLLVMCLVGWLVMKQLYGDLDVDKELDKGLPVGLLNISRKIKPACANLGRSVCNSTIDFVKTYVTDDSVPAASTSGAPAAPARTPAPQEIAMSTSVGGDSPIQGLRHRVPEGQAAAKGGSGAEQTEAMKDR